MNILVIDDDKFITQAINESLTSSGYVVTVVNKSSKIMSEINKINEYDCVLMDLMMRCPPEVQRAPREETGEALYKEIKKKNKKIPIVIMTGKDLSDIKTNFSSMGTKVLLKPFHSKLEEIYEAIKSV